MGCSFSGWLLAWATSLARCLALLDQTIYAPDGMLDSFSVTQNYHQVLDCLITERRHKTSWYWNSVLAPITRSWSCRDKDIFFTSNFGYACCACGSTCFNVKDWSPRNVIENFFQTGQDIHTQKTRNGKISWRTFQGDRWGQAYLYREAQYHTPQRLLQGNQGKESLSH